MRQSIKTCLCFTCECTVLQKTPKKWLEMNMPVQIMWIVNIKWSVSWCKQIYIVVDWLIMTRCAAAVTHSIFISDDGRGGAAGGAAEVWFPVWWVAEQLLPALTLVLDISVGWRLFTSHRATLLTRRPWFYFKLPHSRANIVLLSPDW